METIETWNAIPGFNGVYQVSNLRRVKESSKTIVCGNSYQRVEERILKPVRMDYYNLLLHSLWKQISANKLYVMSVQSDIYLFPERSKDHFSSEFIGVSFNKQTGKWTSNITIKGKHYNLGTFTDEREAGIAYKIAINL